ncbi:MAG: septal ring lytic transglycosylase RlpA family protein [Bacillota bacterium]
MLVLVPQAYANNSNNEDGFKVLMGNTSYNFLQPALEENGEYFLPLRSFFSIFGIQLSWEAANHNVIISADNTKYVLDLDLTNLSINYNGTVVPIKMFNSQIYMPISFMKEIFNYEFAWDGENRTLLINQLSDRATILKNLPEAPQYKVIEIFTGIASWYGGKFHGRETTSGEIFDQEGLTAAHRTLPFGTYLRVTFLETNKSTIVKVNDRGPHIPGRILDLSKGAAEEIDLKRYGLGEVQVEVLENYEQEA